MSFSLKGTVALVTGGASGIGFAFVDELLRNEVKAVTIADINYADGKKAEEHFSVKYGSKKIIFIETDVTKIDQFEKAFLKTLEEFGNLDIVINNAGILDDSKWESEIDINLKGAVHGMLLALEKGYLVKTRKDEEAVIVNVSSVAGVQPYPQFPIYSATKFAIIGLTKSWGVDDHYSRTKVKVLGVCPDATDSNLLRTIDNKNLGPEYQKLLEKLKASTIVQSCEECIGKFLPLIEKAKSGSVWIVQANKDPFEFVHPILD